MTAEGCRIRIADLSEAFEDGDGLSAPVDWWDPLKAFDHLLDHQTWATHVF